MPEAFFCQIEAFGASPGSLVRSHSAHPRLTRERDPGHWHIPRAAPIPSWVGEMRLHLPQTASSQTHLLPPPVPSRLQALSSLSAGFHAHRVSAGSCPTRHVWPPAPVGSQSLTCPHTSLPSAHLAASPCSQPSGEDTPALLPSHPKTPRRAGEAL